MAKYRRIGIAVALALGVALGPALAQQEVRPPADDPSWRECSDTASKVEADLGLPPHILSAVALAETGWSGPNRQVSSWPWTIHDGTRGYHLPTQQAAIDLVRELRAGGRRSVDVGCMQVNLKHHPRAFTSVSEGFEAEANIRYAAGYLRQLALDSGSWEEAIAKYHTQNPGLDLDYAPKVLAFWARERARAADLRRLGGGPALRQAGSLTTARIKAPERKIAGDGISRIVVASAETRLDLSEAVRARGTTAPVPSTLSEAQPLVLRRPAVSDR